MNSRTNSTAVMARRVEPATSLDFFPTPPWATRALPAHVLPAIGKAPEGTAWDPACGEGHMAEALGDYFPAVKASDIHPYGYGATGDFLHPTFASRASGPYDWIITNPPFNLGAEFVLQALKLARVGVAMLVRSAFLEGEDRHRQIFSRRPPQMIAQFSERVPMHRGRWVINGSTATSYAWLVWKKHPTHDEMRHGPRFMWIPKSRKTLSRHDDWLRFAGCMDLPKTHRAMAIMEASKAEAPAEPVAAVAEQLQGMLV